MAHLDIELPGNMTVIGSTTTGKSHLVNSLLHSQLIKQVDALVIMSPTIHLSGDFSDWEENHDMKYGKIIQKFSKPTEFAGIIREIVEQSEGIIKSLGRKECPSTLIILDDMVGHPLLKFRGLLDQLSTKSRHLKISFIVLSQRISAVPRTYRLNSKYFILFNVTNYSELEKFIEEMVPKSMRQMIRNNIGVIFDKKYNYILVSAFNPRITQRMYLNGVENLHDKLNPSNQD